MSAAPLTCRELVELVTDYLEQALVPEDQRRFAEHLSGCGACVVYLDQMRSTIRLSGRLREADLSPAAEAHLRQAFRGWRQGAAP
jgi:hypothetical protein